jgi:arginine exporter protein ArgO
MNTQIKYLIIAFAFFGLALLTAEHVTILAFAALAGMAWAVWKGQLWEVKEEKEGRS